MYRYFSSIRCARGSSSASSLISPYAAKPSVRCNGDLGAMRSRTSLLGSPCSSKCFSGLLQNHAGRHTSLVGGCQSLKTAEYVRGFASVNFSWENLRKNVNAPNPSQHPGDSKGNIDSSSQKDAETTRSSTPMDYVRGIIEQDGNYSLGGSYPRFGNVARDADIVNIKMLRNNTFVTVTDSKGHIKLSASSGCFKELKSGQKLSRYAAEATAEEAGRRCRSLGLKSVVMKVNGFTFFRRKRRAITSWKEGFAGSSARGDRQPIVYIEDTTRRAHNGCRLPKKRRI